MKKEIENREDLYLLVSEFYVKLLNDDSIKYFFDDLMAENGLEGHLKVLVDFWENILFFTGTYRRNAMRPHLIINQTKPFLKEHQFNLPIYNQLSASPKEFETQTIPKTFMINKKGQIVVESGRADWNAKSIRKQIDLLLSE
jgi:hypothetical protein